MICPDCRNEELEENGTPPIGGEGVWEEISHKPRKPKRKKWKLILLLIGLILVLAVAVIVIKVVMFLDGPAVTVARGLYNVLEAESFTLQLSGACNEFQDEIDLDMWVNLDLEDRELTALCHHSEDGQEPETIIIYKGYLITERRRYDSGHWISEGYHARDISDYLDEAFEIYEELGEGEIQWEELLGSYYDVVNRFVNFDDLQDCLISYVKALNDEDWMEEHANFQKSDNNGLELYTLAPDVYEFVMDSAGYFKDAFREEEEYQAALLAVKGLLLSELKNLEAQMVFGMEDDLLVSFEIEGTDTQGVPYEFQIQLSDIGDTEMDEAYLEEFLQQAK